MRFGSFRRAINYRTADLPCGNGHPCWLTAKLTASCSVRADALALLLVGCRSVAMTRVVVPMPAGPSPSQPASTILWCSCMVAWELKLPQAAVKLGP
jgi:hypothetical protein